jgi:hypothetical protein
MASIESLHEKLLLASSLLDEAASEIRDIPLLPASDNIYMIGKALTEVFEVKQVIYLVRPDLKPVELDVQTGDVEANKRLGDLLDVVYQEVRNGNAYKAISLLQEYAANEPSLLHRDIALNEIGNINSK